MTPRIDRNEKGSLIMEDGRSPLRGSGCEASPSAADASSQSRIPNAAPDWELCMNSTSYAELRELSHEVFKLAYSEREDVDLESRVRMACNPMMDGDAGWIFTRTMRGALGFISQLLDLRAKELDRLRPSYFTPAQGIETREGEKPQALSAKHESPVGNADAPKRNLANE